MKKKFTKFWVRTLLLFIIFSTTLHFSANAQQKVKRVVFQAFWWDYWNDNYRFGWANYLAELAPRLKAAGFNAIWIPPSYKNATPDYVGYSPFDEYDLGEKRQKGNGHPLNDRMRTRVGSKDDLLRMIAIMHANGIEVIQDVVLNHTNDAGGGVNTYGAAAPAGTAGAGGQDANATSLLTASGYKNFRYVSYATPALDEYQNDYWTRSGRWAKNYTNYNSCTSSCSDITASLFGPDMNYDANAYGQSSNIPTSGSTFINGVVRNYYNPVQANNYMQDNARDWILWFKKQTGSDGWRWDAVKHFNIATQETSIWHSKYNTSLTSLQAGGQDMFCVGEWVGDQNAIDAYTSSVSSPTAPGGVTNEKHTGTFDFALRCYNSSNKGGLFGMIRGNGAFNMQDLPGEQQGVRYFDYPGGLRVHRSVNFVNSHDTYRPKLSSNGNFLQALGINDNTGWDTGNELGGNGNHIDPREPRLFAGYAACFAMDGNPLVFFEDLFDIGTTGKRYSHIPTNTTDLPTRGDIVNLMQAHQKLAFKDGDYGVPTGANAPFYQSGSSGDHLVIERVGKAVIGITDAYSAVSNNSADQQVYCKINDAWVVGTVLYDYSGAHGISTVTVPADRRLLVQTAPAGHTIANAYGHGYSIWAPAPPGVTVTSVNDLYNYLATYSQPRATTTQQEWEMADDLGDSHCESLGQGGALPTNSTNQRVAGKIYVASGLPITYYVKPEVNGTNITVSLWDLDGNKLNEISGTTSTSSPLTGTYSSSYSGWVVVKVRNTNNTQAGQKCWINVTYTAPTVIDTRATANAVTTRVAVWTGNKGTNSPLDCGNWEEGRMPGAAYNLLIPAYSNPAPVFPSSITVKAFTIETGATLTVNNGSVLTVTDNVNGGGTVNGYVQLQGAAAQIIAGAITVSQLEINNSNNVQLAANITVNNALTLTAGKVVLNANNLTLSSSATITGASSSNYVQTNNTAATGGSLIQNVASSSVIFPIGNTRYTPVTLTNTGNATNMSVRSFESVLQNGTIGSAMTTTGKINKTWLIIPSSTTGLNVNATFNWNAADEDVSFNRNLVAIGRNANTGGSTWFRVSTNGAATGSNPYSYTASGLTGLQAFSVFSDVSVLPVSFIDFSGDLKSKQVILKWTTGSEINNKGFNIERSLNGIDFVNIAFVAASTTNSSIHNYQFADELKGKRIYYRLQQVDNDGKIAYSNVILINNNSSIQLVQVVPNPVKNTLDLIAGNLVTLTTKIQIDVHTSTGVLVRSLNGSFDVVRNAIKTILVNQAAGMYFFTIQSEGEIQRLKVLKQ
jgi:alpha-amylase